jgi:hypothetical protein
MKAQTEKSGTFSSADLAERTVFRRGIETAIWGMPIVSDYAMRQAFFSNGVKYGDFTYFSKPADWKFRVTTPNASSLYVYFNFNTKDGPLVLEFPAAIGAGLFGSILDAWQIPLADFGPEGEDKGKGAKYLILPPDFKSESPVGYLSVRAETYNGYAVLRAIPASSSDADHAKALDLVKQLRLYPLAQAADPPTSKFIDIAGKSFDGIAKMDDTFYDSLAKMVNEEPVQSRDLVAMGQLRSIGIEKGKEFKPDAATRAILKQAAAEAQVLFMDAAVHTTPYWSNAKWGASSYLITGAQTEFTYQTGNFLNIDDRGAMFFFACAAPKKLGAATLYLLGSRDAANALLEGGKFYRFRVPPKVPAK